MIDEFECLFAFGDVVRPIAGADVLVEDEVVLAAELVGEAGDAFAEALQRIQKE